MDKGLTAVPKWVLIVWPKIPKMPQNLSAQFVCPTPKVWYFSEKRLHWASIVRDVDYQPKVYLILYPSLENLTTQIAIGSSSHFNESKGDLLQSVSVSVGRQHKSFLCVVGQLVSHQGRLPTSFYSALYILCSVQTDQKPPPY